jgi:RimJ/RimL family protein N-acetyltransferase
MTSANEQIEHWMFKFRQWRSTDAELYCQMMDNPKIWQMMDGYPGPISKENAKDMIGVANANEEFNKTGEVRAVEFKSKLVGQVRLMQDGDTPHSAEISYLLFEPSWGQGLAAPMLKAYLDDVRARKPEICEVVAAIDTRNAASVKTATKAGFKRMDLPRMRMSGVGDLIFFVYVLEKNIALHLAKVRGRAIEFGPRNLGLCSRPVLDLHSRAGQSAGGRAVRHASPLTGPPYGGGMSCERSEERHLRPSTSVVVAAIPNHWRRTSLESAPRINEK